MIITKLKQGVKNPNRVNVFVDGKYSFSLDVAQVVDYKIKIGLEISDEDLAELKKASEFGKLYQRTLEWVLVRPRSEKETRDYLYKKLRMSSSGRPSEDNSEFSRDIISRLITRGYLNDEKFAEWYVENRFVKKGISKRRLKMELMKKGIKNDIVERVIDLRNDEDEIRKIIEKKRNKYDDEKLINYLFRQGFDYQLARNLVLEKD